VPRTCCAAIYVDSECAPGTEFSRAAQAHRATKMLNHLCNAVEREATHWIGGRRLSHIAGQRRTWIDSETTRPRVSRWAARDQEIPPLRSARVTEYNCARKRDHQIAYDRDLSERGDLGASSGPHRRFLRCRHVSTFVFGRKAAVASGFSRDAWEFCESSERLALREVILAYSCRQRNRQSFLPRWRPPPSFGEEPRYTCCVRRPDHRLFQRRTNPF